MAFKIKTKTTIIGVNSCCFTILIKKNNQIDQKNELFNQMRINK